MVLSRFQGRLSPSMREALAEFISTFILVVCDDVQFAFFLKMEIAIVCCIFWMKFLYSCQSFGLGSVAQMVLSRGKFGTFLSVNFAWGIAVTMGCYWAGGVSGKSSRALTVISPRLANRSRADSDKNLRPKSVLT